MKQYIDFPYKNIPTELVQDYTMYNKIPILKWWLDGTNTIEKQIWDNKYINSYTSRFTIENIKNNKQGKEPYSYASSMILKSIEKYNIRQKDVAVVGSILPWIEAILINYNNKVSMIKYNIPEIDTDKIDIISYWDFEKNDKKFDCIISYSSIEHSV